MRQDAVRDLKKITCENKDRARSVTCGEKGGLGFRNFCILLCGFPGFLQAGEISITDPEWHIPLPAQQAVSGNQAAYSPEFYRLEQTLSDYLRIEHSGGWPMLPDGPDLSIGDRHEQIPILRKRLTITGDYEGVMQADPYFFDTGLERAVLKFRQRHGMAAVGSVNKVIRELLNIPVDKRIRQLRVTLERWRWLPGDRGEQYIWINLADANMKVVEKNKPVLTMRVIVGRPDRATPSFSSEIDRVVFNPVWSVPRSIALEDILPQQKHDSNFINRKRIRVFRGSGASRNEINPEQVAWDQLDDRNFPYSLRQDAGPQNSLGRLKFTLKNPFDIYLHDTPTKLLFHLPGRAFSSGCVRLEQPLELATYLLKQDRQWKKSDIESQVNRQQTHSVSLGHKIPVYFVYLTSWVTEDGAVNFREDIYGRDEEVAKALGL